MTTRNVIIQPYEVPGGTATTEVAVSWELVDTNGAPQLGYDELLGDGVAGAYATTVRDAVVTVPLQLTTELVPTLYWRFKAQWGSLTGYRSYTSSNITLAAGGDLTLPEFLALEAVPGAATDLTANELAAIQEANAPTGLNPFATIGDLTASTITVDASGFDGNLATTDNTVQKVAQKLDDLIAGGGDGDVVDGGTLATGLTFPVAGLHILDTNASHDLILSPGSDLTADRTLTLTTGDADRTLTIGASASVAGSNTGDQDLSGYVPTTVLTDIEDPTGFLNPESIDVQYNNQGWPGPGPSKAIVLTGTLEYYWKGVKHTLTSPWTSDQHASGDGTFYLSSTDGTTFAWSTTPWSFEHIQVARVTIADSGATIIGQREPHGVMPFSVHQALHSNIGTWRKSGLTLDPATYTVNTASDAATTPGFLTGVVVDEDLETTIPAWSQGTYTTVRIGAADAAVFDVAATFPFRSSGSYILVNTPSTGAEAATVTNRYVNVYQLVVPVTSDTESQKYRMLMLQPQVAYTSLAAAQAEDPRGLVLGSLASLATELVFHARITYVTAAGDANTGKCRIATNGVTYLAGGRASQVSISGYTVPIAANVSVAATPSNYTATTPDVEAHLVGIDTALSSAGGLANIVEDLTPQLGGNLDINGFQITGSGGTLIGASAPVLDLTQTWNNAATTFEGIKLNVTNTASSASSKLLDLQVGGVSKASVFSNGLVTFTNQLNVTTISFPSIGGYIYFPELGIFGPEGYYILRLGGGLNAFAFRVYNTLTDGSNYERGVLDWQATSNTLTIGTQAAGTGTLRSVAFVGSSFSFGNPVTVNGGTLTGASAPVLDLSQTWNNAATTFTGLKINVANTASAAGSLLADFQVGGTTKASISKEGYGSFGIGSNVVASIGFGSATNSGFGSVNGYDLYYIRAGSPMLFFGYNRIDFGAISNLSWGSEIGGTPDIYVSRAASGILAQRNGTTAQSFKVANTWTDASNYEYGIFDWQATANTLTIGTQAAGTGTLRGVKFVGASFAFSDTTTFAQTNGRKFLSFTSPVSGEGEAFSIQSDTMFNIFIGKNAGDANVYGGSGGGTGSANTSIGYQTFQSLTTGKYNTALGTHAGNRLTTGESNVFLGPNSGFNVTTGNSNVAIGQGALNTNVSGASNIAVGTRALFTTTASYNVAVGVLALENCTTGTYNFGLGYNALNYITTGSSNIAIGLGAGLGLTTGGENVFIGTNTSGTSATSSNEFVAGGNLFKISNVYFDRGVTHASPAAWTLHGTGGSGTNVAGGGITIAGGIGTGTGIGGSIVFQTAAAGSTGSTPNTLATAFTIAPGGVGFFGVTPAAQQATVADASTAHAITDPTDAPADADALREDLVTNVIPSVETSLNNLGTKINSILATLEAFGFHATA